MEELPLLQPAPRAQTPAGGAAATAGGAAPPAGDPAAAGPPLADLPFHRSLPRLLKHPRSFHDRCVVAHCIIITMLSTCCSCQRQAADEGCHKSHPSMDSPDPRPNQSWAHCFVYVPAPAGWGPVYSAHKGSRAARPLFSWCDNASCHSLSHSEPLFQIECGGLSSKSTAISTAANVCIRRPLGR